MRTPGLLAAVLLGSLLAGCTGGSDDPLGNVDASLTTGGIRGVVVDASITPVAGARVAVSNGPNATTDEQGTFRFGGLAPGEYFLTVTKTGYSTVQQSASVVANVADPPAVKVIVQRLPNLDPFIQHFRLEGFYECGFAAPVITDQCDFGVRTLYDQFNGTTPVPYPLPRNVQQGANTQYFDIAPSATAVIQEAFWTDETVTQMMVSLDETPIDNACDCSDSYMQVVMGKPTYARSDNVTSMHGKTVAARGFLPFTDVDPANPQGAAGTAVSFQFTIITTVFHNHTPPEGWTFETRANHPLPK